MGVCINREDALKPIIAIKKLYAFYRTHINIKLTCIELVLLTSKGRVGILFKGHVCGIISPEIQVH